VDALGRDIGVTSVSSLYETEPMGVVDQPPYLNLALAARTKLAPEELLARLKQIERDVGREPTFRWGPRVVDLDILLYGDLVVSRPHLTIPHAEMANRAFVLVPLAEIAPEVMHPVLGVTVERLRERVHGTEGVRPVGAFP
jgi:2-amino-4-hydroxy-6-hydroxymethyldihydropteridine diphosphokinase